MPSFLDASGLSKLLQKIKTVFATKSELAALGDSLTAETNQLGTTFVHKTGNETISGTKTFSSTISGSIDGNAGSASKLQTARTINGVSFDGTGNITVADSTKVPLSGGNLTGRCKITGNNFGWQVTNGTETIEFMIGSGKVNRGFWDTKLNKWAVYANDSEVILNGRATGSGSDRRIKQDFSQIPDSVLDAWDKVHWQRFKLRREAAGDCAPYHTGAVVQDIQESLREYGVEPEDYALAYHEPVPLEEGDHPSEDNPEIMNSEKWYLRYEEAYAIEAAYLRRRCQKLEERIAALEAKGE